MNIQPRRNIEMTSGHRPHASPETRAAERIGRSSDVFEREAMRVESSALSSSILIRPITDEPTPGLRRQAVQDCNQTGWAGFTLRFLPLIALALTATGLAYSYMNHRAITAQKTLKLVSNLQPSILEAHQKILAAVHSIQAALGINSTDTDQVGFNISDLDRG